jgi:hypothetical protein
MSPSPVEPPIGGAYRSPPPKVPRFICCVCFQTATTDEAGVCPCAGPGAPRLPVDNSEVVEMVRARVAARRQRRVAWKVGAVIVAAVTASLGICYAFGWETGLGGVLRTTPFEWIAFTLLIVFGGAAAYLDRSPPTDIQGLLTWLRVRITDGKEEGV